MTHPVSDTRRDPVAVLHERLEAQPGGIRAAAKTIGRSAGVLYNKFADSMPHYEISLREALALAQPLAERSDFAFAEAVCEQFGGVFVPLPEGQGGADDVLAAHLEVMTHIGDLCRELTEARQDGLIDEDEFTALKVRGNRAIRALHCLIRELEAQVPPQRSGLREVG